MTKAEAVEQVRVFIASLAPGYPEDGAIAYRSGGMTLRLGALRALVADEAMESQSSIEAMDDDERKEAAFDKIVKDYDRLVSLNILKMVFDEGWAAASRSDAITP